MSAGARAEALPDGTISITLEAANGKVTLRVTKAYARKLAARLMSLSMEEPGDMARTFIDDFKRNWGGD